MKQFGTENIMFFEPVGKWPCKWSGTFFGSGQASGQARFLSFLEVVRKWSGSGREVVRHFFGKWSGSGRARVLSFLTTVKTPFSSFF